MKIFDLPDLGEGLPDATIREWYVKIGDDVKVDQPLAAMETAKALVDVPAPFSGKVKHLFGNVGDTIETGQPLIGFEAEAGEKDAGTVVGSIEESDRILKESATGIVTQKTTSSNVKATPAVRMLAKELGVNLEKIHPAGAHITAEEVKQAAKINPATTSFGTALIGDVTPLEGVRKAMVLSMRQSHQEVVPVTIMDDADLHEWEPEQDITVRLIRAVQAACTIEPMLNAYFDSSRLGYQLNREINLGMAVDTPHGLYVPVIKNIANQSNRELRETINRFKEQARTRSIPAGDLKNATLVLSNFGALAGRYASPIIIPPTVAIIGVGKTRDTVVAQHGHMAIHKIMPLSLTADHRLVTGGEMARFLRALMDELEKPNHKE